MNRATTLRGLVGMLAAAATALIVAAPAAAQCDPPLRATIKFDGAPADVTFSPLPAPTPIKIVLQIENCSGAPVLTTDGFSATDFFRRLYFVDPNGGTITNKAEEVLHATSPVFFCLSRNGALQSPGIPVVPVEVLAGPQTPPHFFREYVVDDARILYALDRPGRYSVSARIPLLTFDAGDPSATFGDCDQLEGTTVVNVGSVSGRHEFTVVSNTLELSIAAPPPTRLALSPGQASTVTGVNRTYTAEGLDAADNSLGDVTGQTMFTIDPDGSCSAASCAATTPGPHTVTGRLGTAQGTAELQVNVGALDRLAITPSSSSISPGGSQLYATQGFDAFNNSLGGMTGVTTFTIGPDGSCTAASCTATAPGSHTVTASAGGKQATATLLVQGTGNSLTLGSAKVWVGLANSDDVGLKFDLQAIVKKNGTQVGTGQVTSVAGGSSGFNNAKLDVIPLVMSAPVTVASGDTLSIQVLVRNACSGSGKNSGRARLWFDGAAVDSGKAADAGSRFDATIGTSQRDYFLLTGSVLSTVAGSARASVDAKVGQKCGPFTSFGTWSTTLP